MTTVRWQTAGIMAIILASAAALAPFPTHAADTCEGLAAATLPFATITSATLVAPGAFVAPGAGGRGAAPSLPFATLPAFCRVQAALTPTPDSDIRIEVWLPAEGWNGKLQSVGGRGLGGVIVYPALAAAVAAGYAGAGTDSGHAGPGGAFALGHPEKLVDVAYRAVHEMTIQAKRIIDRFYGRTADRSYWNGCSFGGRQGLAEAQRYPADYDGIVVGDVANDVTGLYAARLVQAQAVHRSSASPIPPAKYRIIHAAVVAACDRLDNVADGVLENPAECGFDPKSIVCEHGDAPSCLTPEQVETARALYAPVRDPRTNAVISNGLMRGSELGWAAVAGPQPESNSVEVYKFMVFRNPQWDWQTFDLKTALAAAAAPETRVIDAVEPNLKPFFERGGKLLMYHGWSDPQTPPLNSIEYYTRVRTTAGAAITDQSMRLFMVPGMGHCENGEGTDVFDKVAPLSKWVEHGTAPERIDATRVTDNAVTRSRPLCPYGTVARWDGHGDTNLAASFSCTTVQGAGK
jgi:feruloyl esterase